MSKRYVDGRLITLYLSSSVIEKGKAKCNRLGIKFSSKVNDLLSEWVESDEDELDAEYEKLKREQESLNRRMINSAKIMKNLRIYDQFLALMQELGLQRNLENVDEVISTLVSTYNGSLNNLNIFVNYLEVAKKLAEVNMKLKENRDRKYLLGRGEYFSSEGVEGAVQETVAHPHPVRGAGSVPKVREPRAEENP